MKLTECHVIQDAEGRIKRVEFRDGPQRMEVTSSRLIRTDEVGSPPYLEVTIMAKPIYHVEDAA